MSDSRLTPLGTFLTIAIIGGLIGLGAWLMLRPQPVAPTAPPTAAQAAQAAPVNEAPDPDAPKTIEPATSVVRLDAAAPHVPKSPVIEVSISEYAGYAGLLAANGGQLEPNAGSLFTSRYGIQVRLHRAEEDLFSDVNSGKLAALATTNRWMRDQRLTLDAVWEEAPPLPAPPTRARTAAPA